MPAPVTALPATSVFGAGLFGQAASGEGTPGNSLFALLVALFGQNLTPNPADITQNLSDFPATPAPALAKSGFQLPARLDPEQLILTLTAPETGSGNSLNDRLSALLDLLQQQDDKAPALTDFLEGFGNAPITPAAVHKKLATLDETEQNDILADVQSLLAALVPPPVPTPDLPQLTAEPAAPEVLATAAPLPPEPNNLPDERPDQLPAKDKTPAAEAPTPEAEEEVLAQTTDDGAPRTPAAAKADKPAKPAASPKGIDFSPLLTPAATQTPDNQSNPVNIAITDLAKTIRDAIETRRAAPAGDDAAPAPTAPALAAAADAGQLIRDSAPTTKPTTTAAVATTLETVATRAGSGQLLSDGNDNGQLNGNANGQTPLLHPAATGTQNSSFADELNAIRATHGLPHTPVSHQIAVHLQKAGLEGQDRITIRLQPPELGRIDVQLHLGGDGRVMAHISADNPLTLDLMKRDTAGLERALSDAGLKADSNSLNFNLRGEQQQGGQQGQQQMPQQNSSPDFWSAPADPLPPGIEMTWFVSPDRVDVRI